MLQDEVARLQRSNAVQLDCKVSVGIAVGVAVMESVDQSPREYAVTLITLKCRFTRCRGGQYRAPGCFVQTPDGCIGSPFTLMPSA